MRWPGWLDGQERWRGTDAVRILTAAAVPVVWVLYGGPAASAMFLALGGTMAVRFCRLGAVQDAVCQAVFFLSAWWAADGSYERWGPLDMIAHAASGAVLAILLHQFLPRRVRGRRRDAVRIAGWVLVLGVLWEIGEQIGHRWLSRDIHVGTWDTLTDLLADVAGGAVAAVLLTRSDRRSSRGTSVR